MKRILLDTKVYEDLERLAGTWNEKDLMEFEKNIADFEVVDENIWK